MAERRTQPADSVEVAHVVEEEKIAAVGHRDGQQLYFDCLAALVLLSYLLHAGEAEADNIAVLRGLQVVLVDVGLGQVVVVHKYIRAVLVHYDEAVVAVLVEELQSPAVPLRALS